MCRTDLNTYPRVACGMNPKPRLAFHIFKCDLMSNASSNSTSYFQLRLCVKCGPFQRIWRNNTSSCGSKPVALPWTFVPWCKSKYNHEIISLVWYYILWQRIYKVKRALTELSTWVSIIILWKTSTHTMSRMAILVNFIRFLNRQL